jgi:two-component system cell cycle response regulator
MDSKIPGAAPHPSENPQPTTPNPCEKAATARATTHPLALWPSLPQPIAEINKILIAEPLDLRQLTQVTEQHPEFSGRIVKLSNSSLFSLPYPISTLAQAAMVIHSDVLRTLALTCYLIEYIGKTLSLAAGLLFWRHGLLAAVLSQRLSQWSGFGEPELAYFAGMLHDIGWLPLLAHAAVSDASVANSLPSLTALEERHRERGFDHCALGTAIGGLWNFPSALVEVFGFHHEPERAPNCPELVGMVAIADACAHLSPIQIRSGETSPEAEKGSLNYGKLDALRRLDPQFRLRLAETLTTESRRVDQWLQQDFMRSSISSA